MNPHLDAVKEHNLKGCFKMKRTRFIIRRTALLLAIMLCAAAAHAPAYAGAYSSTIRSIHSSYSHQDTMAKNIYQQICNGTYRTVELLEVIARILDEDDAYGSTIRSIHSSYSHQDTMAKNIYQQICNGTYRSTELLEVIARELDAQT